MRKQVYLSLIERLKQITDSKGNQLIKTFDLWNEQVDFIEQEDPFDVPAAFIEFLPVEWKTMGGHVQQADVSIRLHIVTSWEGPERDGSQFQEQALRRFDLLEQVGDKLFNFTGKNERGEFNMFQRTGSVTNHNHEELVEDIETFRFRVYDKISQTN